MTRPATPLLDEIESPADLRQRPVEELRQIADELRAETISAVSETGGHLGAGLGVVELTVALHAVFDTPHDKLIWDVSHQSYPHKILTGRRDRIRTLRQRGGLSGFTRRDESPYDPFGTAHSSTSLSAALGFAQAREMGAETGDAIAVMGDGALSAGMAYEALNNAGAWGGRLFVILNDNGMSIAEPTGAVAALLQGNGDVAGFFGALGFSYEGVLDGHDMASLHKTLTRLKADATGPTLLHVRTKKGKGFPPAEAARDKYHGVPKFNAETGEKAASTPRALSYTRVFADTLTTLAKADRTICAITAAMPDGTGLDRFAAAHPDRAFDVGISEQHAVTFAAGLAAGNMRPFCALYSTFLQRAYDQVVHDVALQGLPVRFAIDRAGLVGADGPSHAGAYDIAFLANLPGFTIMAAADEAELVRMVATAAAHDRGPIALRFPRGEGTGADLPDPTPLPIGKGRVIRGGDRAAVLSFGARLAEAEAAADMLAAEGTAITVADARFAKPLDTALLDDLARGHDVLITVEEGAAGGFGAQVASHLAQAGHLDGSLLFRMLTLPDSFIDQGTPEEMYAEAGLDAASIAATLRELLRD